MKLLIVESPAKAKTISKYLDDAYTVRASVGHIRDLPKSNKNAIDIAAGFVPYYVISPGKEKVVSELKSLAKRAERVVLATDPDREGEAIAWHIKEACGLKRPERIVFHEITREAVRRAMAEPRAIDENLRAAQEARRVLDRLFGYDLSGLIWRKLRYGLSAGRVQSPALRILVEREREIRAFIPEKFWIIEAVFKTPDQQEIKFTCLEEPPSGERAEQIVARAKQSDWRVAQVTQTESRRAAKPPFITSTLQQAASSRLGYSPSMTMRLAQKLYEAGHITYMRTDSTNLSGHTLAEIAAAVKEKFGDKYLAAKTYATRSKVAQEAHEAIRPARAAVTAAGVTAPEKKLYQLIWSRAVSSQMADALTAKTEITARANNGQVPDFAASGAVITFDGWLKADPAARGEETELPPVKKNTPLKLAQIEALGKETQPPKRYSEAGLVKELEKRGIGRPSTYAPTIKTIIDRGYAEKDPPGGGRSLKPTETGEIVSGFLEQYFADYISDDFTREMEDKLDQIADGEREYVKTLKDFYGPFQKAVKARKDVPKLSNLGQAPPEIKCPLCNGPMIIKLGRAGKFYSCTRFPECTGARTLDGKEITGPKATGEKCPECADGQLVEREGRYGKFIACSNYPKCKYVKRDENTANSSNDTKVPCPACKKGTMVEKRGRYGVFYGCSHYPACKNILKTKPTGEVCRLCGSLMMTGTKTIPDRCSNKSCQNHQPARSKNF